MHLRSGLLQHMIGDDARDAAIRQYRFDTSLPLLPYLGITPHATRPFPPPFSGLSL